MTGTDNNMTFEDIIFMLFVSALFWGAFIFGMFITIKLSFSINIMSYVILFIITLTLILLLVIGNSIFKVMKAKNKIVDYVELYSIDEYKDIQKENIITTIIVLIFATAPIVNFISIYLLLTHEKSSNDKDYRTILKEIEESKDFYLLDGLKNKIDKDSQAIKDFNILIGLILELKDIKEYKPLIHNIIELLDELLTEKNQRAQHMSNSQSLDEKLKETITTFISFFNNLKIINNDEVEIKGFTESCERIQNILNSISTDILTKKGIFKK